MAETYRPRRATEIVDAAVQLFRRHPGTFLAIGAVVQVPMLLLRAAAMTVYGIAADGTPNNVFASAGLSIADGILWLLATAALISAADRAYMGASPDVRSSFAVARSRFGPFFVAMFLSSVLFFAGILLLLVGALYFLAKYGLAAAIAVLEPRSGTSAMTRASSLSEGRKRHILAALGTSWLIFFALVVGATAVSALIPHTSTFLILVPLVNILAYPIVAIVLVITYYDLRIRAEGYDIELLEREAGSTEPAVVATA